MAEAFGCQADPWLSEILGRPVWKVSLLETTRSEWTLPKELSRKGSFGYLKLAASDESVIGPLVRLGWNLVETAVLLEKDPLDFTPPNEGVEVRFATAMDENEVVGIASSSFEFSRFHRDPRIPRPLADKVKSEWARNFFTGCRGTHMVVACKRGRVVGFLQLLRNEEGSLTIDLIAVASHARGCGVAKNMIRFAETKCSGIKNMLVGTQLRNTGSIRTYESIGFRFLRSSFTFHLHEGRG